MDSNGKWSFLAQFQVAAGKYVWIVCGSTQNEHILNTISSKLEHKSFIFAV